MPIYEYTCIDCQSSFELIRSMAEADSDVECTQCHGSHVQRQLSMFNATSGGRSVAGSNTTSCNTCTGRSCSTCGSHAS